MQDVLNRINTLIEQDPVKKETPVVPETKVEQPNQTEVEVAKLGLEYKQAKSALKDFDSAIDVLNKKGLSISDEAKLDKARFQLGRQMADESAKHLKDSLLQRSESSTSPFTKVAITVALVEADLQS